jgi:hypothetical protein
MTSNLRSNLVHKKILKDTVTRVNGTPRVLGERCKRGVVWVLNSNEVINTLHCVCTSFE